MHKALYLLVLSSCCSFLGLVAQRSEQELLEASPRHQEWVRVPQGAREVESFLVFPEVATKATAVIVIHENRGLTDWVRTVVDRLAAAGYIAIAPDLLSGMGPGGGKTSDFSGTDAAREALYQLAPEQVIADLNAVLEYVSKLPASNGKVAVAGFCWGGSRTFHFAGSGADVAAAFVFYGSGPEEQEGYAGVRSPVYGFYGGNDARVNATIAQSKQSMQDLGKIFEPVVYEGAGHGFMRSGDESDASEANRKARDEGWKRWLDLLGKIQ